VQANNERFETSAQPLTIAVKKTSYPYIFLNDKGEADGLMPDVWELWVGR
jgi:hypothetical protein